MLVTDKGVWNTLVVVVTWRAVEHSVDVVVVLRLQLEVGGGLHRAVEVSGVPCS